VLSVHAQPADAEATSSRVRQAGFDVRVVEAKSGGYSVPGLLVREFALSHDRLTVQDRAGHEADLPFAGIELLVRGVSMMETRTTTTTKVKKFSVGRAVLSGGLVMRKTEEKHDTSTSAEFDAFLYVYSAGRDSPVCLRENGMLYQALGAAMQPSRAANFTYVTGQLRQLSTTAIWDDRLMRRAIQKQILGPMLAPEDHIGLAVTLIASSHAARRNS
jgi:hypothetical protein